MIDRAEAQAWDAADPLADWRTKFEVDDAGPIYMDGNSLGRPPKAALAAIASGLEEWRTSLVSGWERWLDLPVTVGDRLGRILGASPGQTVVCDSTTVNLYKAVAALISTGRRLVIGHGGDFPTDRYVLQGLAAATGTRLEFVSGQDVGSAVVDAASSEPAVVCLSHVDYRFGQRLDVPTLTAALHRVGALVVWDLSHSAGAIPLRLDDWDVDLAVGCTYKYLNAGPGAPGYVYISAKMQPVLRQPVWGWFGQGRQFAMGAEYDPAPGARGWLTGTPNALALLGVEAALSVTEEAGVDRLWEKSQRMTTLLIDLFDERLAPLGVGLATPIEPTRRGAHVSFSYPRAWAWCRTLIERGLVVGDFRAADILRIGPAPLYTRYVDCWDAIDSLAAVLEAGLDDHPDPDPQAVT